MADVIDLFGRALSLFAVRLQNITLVPWPLVIGALFLPLVAALRTTLWVLRGTVWLVPCKYFHTQQRRLDKACRVLVPGEWHYCRHHRYPRIMSDRHNCDPKIPRWQRRDRTGKLTDRDDIRGVGFVRLLSNRETLLFYKGIAKRPHLVWRRFPEFLRQLPAGWSRFREVERDDLFRRSPHDGPIGVAERMPRVVQATQLSLSSFTVGLFLAIIAILLGRSVGWRTGVQYSSTAAFIAAWDLLRFGIWKESDEEPRWVKATLVDTAKSMALLVVLAVASAALLAAAGHTSSSA